MRVFLLDLIIFFVSAFSFCSAEKFRWIDEPGKYVDLAYGKKKIARYVYQKMDPKNREQTYKPFHHIYQDNGKDFLTKGPGGKYTHHRGIYFGFSKCTPFDKTGKVANVDTWHCKRAYQVHESIISQKADKENASHTVKITWRMDDGTIFVTELRKLSFSRFPDNTLQVDFKSSLSTNQEKVSLDGDPQHAGFQFRASNEVAVLNSKKTYYIRPNEGRDKESATKNWPKDKDMTNLLWKGQSIVVDGQRYTTLYLDHPSNPKPSYYSERDYGRFGSYFKAELTPLKKLKVSYRLLIGLKERNLKDCEGFSQDFVSTK